jgi:hypothetical protein
MGFGSHPHGIRESPPWDSRIIPSGFEIVATGATSSARGTLNVSLAGGYAKLFELH